jgi:hypothetical protein
MTRADRFALGAGLLCPWLFIWQGLDFTDQGYLVTGYRCFLAHPEVTEDSGHMWLTNLIGALWDALFGGLGIVSMRALWAACLSLGLLGAFRLARSFTTERAAALGVLVAGAFLSDRRETWFSYNTLSSLLLAAAACCVIHGATRGSRRWLVAGGALIGLAPFARFPNILMCALGSAPLLAAWLEPARRRGLLADLGAVIGGAAGAVVGMLLLIYLRSDFTLYREGLVSLFAPAMQNAGYASDDLAESFLRDQSTALAWGVAICALGYGAARVLANLPKVAQLLLLLLLSALGIWGLARDGEPWRFAVPGASCVLLALLVLGKGGHGPGQRVAAWVLLIAVLIAPLGSNNGIKNAHMGLWVALPFLAATLYAGGPDWLKGQASKLAVVMLLVLGGEACHRAWTYTYRDQERVQLTTGIDHPQLRAQFTTAPRAKAVAEVLRALETRVSPGDYLLGYEGTPLIHYLTRTRPYLNRPWLMGWERPEVVKQLVADAPRRTGCLPVVVTTTKTTRRAEWPLGRRVLDSRPAQRGVRAVLTKFLKKNGYERSWSNGFFEIFEPPGPKRAACR